MLNDSLILEKSTMTSFPIFSIGKIGESQIYMYETIEEFQDLIYCRFQHFIDIQCGI